MKTNALSLALIGVGFLCIAIGLYFLSFGLPAFGSVSVTDEYISTSTAPSASSGAWTLTTTRLLKTGTCTLGSVIVTGTNTSGLDFYDATTSNISARTGQKATSSILLASLPPSPTVGTYTFDVGCKDGLLVSAPTGTGATVPTTTITYRLQ